MKLDETVPLRLSINEEIQKLRHILYRVKAKLLFRTKAGKLLRSLGWKEATEADGLKTIYEYNADVLSAHAYTNIHDPQVIKKFTWENTTWTNQSDTIYLAEGHVFLEPEHGLAFFKKGKLIVQTKSRAHTYLLPSLWKFACHQILRRRYTRYPELIHFDGYASKNLYHFFDDALNGLLLILKEGNLSRKIPVLVSERVYKRPYFQFILTLPEFKALTWVIQKDAEWVKTDRMYKAVASHRLWSDVYHILDKSVTKKPIRRIFLNRTTKFQRRLNNNEAIEQILRGYGFETIYAENMSYGEQVKLFAETEYLVALHGAGITNLIFSDLEAVHLLEIFSESLMHPHYYWFLEHIGIHYYDGITASKFDINWNYTLNEEKFKIQLDKMMGFNEEQSNDLIRLSL